MNRNESRPELVRSARRGVALALIGAALASLALPDAGLAKRRRPPASPPANTSPPTIAGTAQVGQTLTASPGTWTGSPAPTYTYAWQRCDAGGGACVGTGATATTYVPGAADQGRTMRVVVTASNTAGSQSATSAATAVVQAASTPPPPPPPPPPPSVL